MQLRFYANMRTVIGRASLEIQAKNINTLRQLLDFLVTQFPESAFHLLENDGSLRQDVPVYIDGRNPRLLKDGIDTYLQSDSVISFFSPIASGKMNVEVLREPASRNKE